MQSIEKNSKAIAYLATLFLIIGIIISTLVGYKLLKHYQEQEIEAFAFNSKQLVQKIDNQIHSYSLILKASSAFFMGSDEVTRKEWSDYVQTLGLNHADGIQTIGYNPLISQANLPEHIKKMLQDGFADYTVRPDGVRELYAPIVYAEPFSGENLKILGYDALSQSLRKLTMQRAQDSGEPRMSSKIDSQMIIYSTIYKKDTHLKNAAQRRQATTGWVFLSFDFDAMVLAAFKQPKSDFPPNVSIRVYDKDIIYGNETELEEPTPMYQEIKYSFEDTSYIFQIDCASGLGYTGYWEGGIAFIFGSILSVLLFLLLLDINKTKKNALKIAERALEKIEIKDVEIKKNEALLQALVSAAPDLVWLKDPDGVYLTCNPRFESFFGANSADILGKTDYDFVDKSIADAFGANDKLSIIEGTTRHNEEELVFKSDGHHEILDTSKTPVYDASQNLIGVLGIGRDITERKKAQEHVRKLSIALEQSPASVIITDADANVEYVNPRFSEITGFTLEEILHHNPRILQSGATSVEVYKDMWQNLTNGKVWSGELLNKRKNGETYWEEARIAPVLDEHGTITNYIGLKIDITKRKNLEEQIRHLAFYDALTGLANRRLIDDRLKIALSKSTRSGLYGALIFLDLDNFKSLNDTYGHEAGDMLLKEAAKRLQSCMRDIDTVGRFGGDEFVVILSDLYTEYENAKNLAQNIAKKIQNSLGEAYHLRLTDAPNKEIIHTCTASIGVSLFLDHKNQQEKIMQQADNAMYQAKETGKNQLVFGGQV